MADWEPFVLAVMVGLLMGLALGAASQNTRVDELDHTITNLQGNLTQTRNALNQSLAAQENLIGNYSTTQKALNAPGVNTPIFIWTIPQTLKPRTSIDWFLLDTFDNMISVSTSGPANFLILSQQGFGNYTHAVPFVPIDNYTGTNYVRNERLSQGCSGYVLVVHNFTNTTETVRPNIWAIYAPTPFLTGECGTPP